MENNKKYLRNRTEEVIKKSAIVSSLDDFLITHVPFKELKYCPSGIDDSITKKYSEEQLYNEFILTNRTNHNLIVVQGNNGSGKSHFIRWLKYKYDNELRDKSEISILIERNYNTLQGTIEQLLSNDIIKKFVSKEQLDKLNEAGKNISTEKFLTIMNFTFVAEIMREEDEECKLNSLKRRKLASFLKNELVMDELMLKSKGPIKRIAQKLSTDSKEGKVVDDDIRFKEEDFELDLGEFVEKLRETGAEKDAVRCAEDLAENRRGFRKDVVDYLNSKLDDVIQSIIKLNSQDLNNMLFNIRRELYKVGKNLTLFIEDITSFTGIDRAIIENLIIEHTTENEICRLFSVVGITGAYYQGNFPDNLKDRVTSRIVIDEQSIFGDENSILDIAARYINAINLDRDEIRKWVIKGASEQELPIVPSKVKWATYIDNEDRRFNIYPFNKNAIVNLYNQLQTKTPRMVISHIILPVFMKFTSEESLFPQGISELEGVLLIPEFKDNFTELKINEQLEGEERERFKSLIRIWGDSTLNVYDDGKHKRLGGIDDAIFKEFNIPMINGDNVTSKEIYKKNIEKEINDEKKDVSLDNNENAKVTIRVEPKKEIKNIEYENIIQDLNSWFKNKTPLKSHSRIRDYIVVYLKDSIYWEMEDLSQLSSLTTISKNVVMIEDQLARALLEDNCIYFERSEENYYFFMALVDYNLLGKRKWNFEGASERIILLSTWNENNKEKIISSIKRINGENFDIYSYALINNYYINTVCNTDNCNNTDIYCGLLTKEIDTNSETARKILDLDISKLNHYKEDVKENKELVLRYYNCKLGDADITKTNSFYLDAAKIISKIEGLKLNDWDINSDDTVQNLSGTAEAIYNLYSTFIKKEMKDLVDSKISKVLNNIKEFRMVTGYDEDYRKTMLAIKEFYKAMKLANISYNQSTYSLFEEKLLKKPNVNNILKQLEMIKDNCLIDKIKLLSKNYLIVTTKLKELVKEMEKTVNAQYQSKKLSNNYNEIQNELTITKDKVFTTLNSIINEIDEVNGGDMDAIK